MSAITATITSGGKPIDPTYEVISLDIRKAINKIPTAEMVLIDGNPAKREFSISNSKFFEPGHVMVILLRYEGETGPSGKDQQVFKGIVVKQELKGSPNGTLLKVGLKDVAYQLTTQRKSVVFSEVTDSDVWQQLLEPFPEVEVGSLTSTDIVFPEMIQYACSNWDFLVTRADANGFWVALEDGKISIFPPKPKDKPVGTIDYGIDSIYDFEFELDTSRQYSSVLSTSWDSEKQKMTDSMVENSFELVQGNMEVEPKFGATDHELLIDSGYMTKEERKAWAKAAMIKSRMSMLRGRIQIEGRADWLLGSLVEIKGLGKRFNGNTPITGIRHRVNKDGWLTDCQFGASPDWFSERPDMAKPAASGLVAPVAGLQIGIVVKVEEDPKGEYRVRVKIPTIDKPEDNMVWARLASIYSGEKHGVVFRPNPNDEVVLGFLGADPRQAIILGAMHSKKQPPPLEPDPKKPKNGIVTPEQTKLLFDGENISVSLETPKGNSLTLTEKDDQAGILWKDQNENQIQTNSKGISIHDGKEDQIVITQGESITIQDQAGNQVVLNQKEGITLQDKNGNQFKMTGNGIEMDSSQPVTINGSEVHLK